VFAFWGFDAFFRWSVVSDRRFAAHNTIRKTSYLGRAAVEV
jgi:hypothetical protein